ncbi:hypothetical protein AAE478_006326 [Parahypoxylon ruwenzoriense]
MDGTGGTRESRERLYPRAPSRASTTSTANTQITPKSVSSSSSHVRETHTSSHASHKYHHSHCGKSLGGTRPTSRLSRESSVDLREPAASASSFLQERLQRERKVESERQASKLGIDLSASTADIRDADAQGSPVRKSTTATGRMQGVDSNDEFARGTGMGAKQLEKTLSTLHKQNFDLKLELYHRRERQTTLEEKVEKLEAENSDTMDLQESLVSELELKDKAIEEAVNMIVKLEARVDELIRERAMVREVEADGSYRHSHSDEPDPELTTVTTPKMKNLALPNLANDVKVLERMPSFLSEHSVQTENLRNVVLGKRSSLAHMRKVSGSSADPSEINRIASPSLSVLSESSFISIYGAKDAQDKTNIPPTDSTVGMDGSQAERSPVPTRTTSKENWYNQQNVEQSQMPVGAPGGRARLSTHHIQSLNNILDLDSPLQKLEKLEQQVAVPDGISRQSVADQRRGAAPPPPWRPAKPQQQGRTKHEKREALQKVLTNYPMYRDFASPHAYPPTPDTVSSSTLRKHQAFTGSQDSLGKQAGTITGDGPSAASDRSGVSARGAAYKTPTALFSSRRQMPMPSMNPDLFNLSQLARSLPPRPHSAAETMSSHARADSLVSDSDSDGGADAHSEADSFDYWMRESMKPNRHHTSSSEQRGDGRSTSPDLFSFPADAKGWETDVIFGALKGSGYLGSPVSALKRDPIDEIANSLQPSQADAFDPPMQGTAPPTPDRRSTLHARTGSTSAVAPSSGRLKKSPTSGPRISWLDGRSRSNSVDCAVQGSSIRMQAQLSQLSEAGKRNQYPPISGQPSRGRGLGLNSFFKRVGSESTSVPPSATETIFPVPTPAQLPPLAPHLNSARLSGRSSVPPPATMPWVMRPPGILENDFKSATPPPIMRNRVPPPLSGISDAEVAKPGTPQPQPDGMVTPTTPTTVMAPPRGSANVTPNGAQNAVKRKWLNLARMGSLKNRIG